MESKYQTGRFPALLQVSWVTSGKSPTLKWLGGVITRELDHPSSPFAGGLVVKNPPVSARDTRDAGSIPGSGRSPGGGNGNPLQYSCLENPMGRGARWATQRVGHNWAHSANTQLPAGSSDLWLLLVDAVSRLVEREDLGLASIHLCDAVGRRASSGY